MISFKSSDLSLALVALTALTIALQVNADNPTIAYSFGYDSPKYPYDVCYGTPRYNSTLNPTPSCYSVTSSFSKVVTCDNAGGLTFRSFYQNGQCQGDWDVYEWFPTRRCYWSQEALSAFCANDPEIGVVKQLPELKILYANGNTTIRQYSPCEATNSCYGPLKYVYKTSSDCSGPATIYSYFSTPTKPGLCYYADNGMNADRTCENGISTMNLYNNGCETEPIGTTKWRTGICFTNYEKTSVRYEC